jgi:hypothetical protein
VLRLLADTGADTGVESPAGSTPRVDERPGAGPRSDAATARLTVPRLQPNDLLRLTSERGKRGGAGRRVRSGTLNEAH